MINALLRRCYACPVCGRIIYGPLKGWWCPYCGRDFNTENATETNFTERLTARAENGMPYYIGRFSFRDRAYAQDLSISAIADILEKLAQYEDLAEEEEKEDSEEESGE